MITKYLRRNGPESLPIGCCIVDDNGNIGVSFPCEADIEKTLRQKVSIRQRLYQVASGRLAKYKSASLVLTGEGGFILYNRKTETFPPHTRKKLKPSRVLLSPEKVSFITSCIDENIVQMNDRAKREKQGDHH